VIHSTATSGKFRRLVRKLRPLLGDVPCAVETIAVGLLERLWHVAISSAFRGDIGRFDNEEIAEMIGWHGEADVLIALLVSERWLDHDPTYRLLVHDWHEHAPRHVKANAAKQGGLLTSPSERKGIPSELEEEYKEPPNDAKGVTPNQTQPNQTSIPAGRVVGRREGVPLENIYVDDEVWSEALPLMQRIAAVIEPGRPLKAKDRELCAVAAVVAVRLCEEPWLDDVLDCLKKRSSPPDKPWGYFKMALAKSATRAGWNYHEVARVVEIPEHYLAPRKQPAL
jgi:hypothetical protein